MTESFSNVKVLETSEELEASLISHINKSKISNSKLTYGNIVDTLVEVLNHYNLKKIIHNDRNKYSF